MMINGIEHTSKLGFKVSDIDASAIDKVFKQIEASMKDSEKSNNRPMKPWYRRERY
jgi:hypothetical protein